MHILFLSDNFLPESNAPAKRTFEHCKTWVQLGHRVTVITCFPNFPRGEVYPGYKNKLYEKSVIQGIEVVRVFTYMTANDGVWRRTLDYASFMVASFIAGIFVSKPDVLIATSPQFFTACAGSLLSRCRGLRWVLEIRDLWPDSIEAVNVVSAKPAISLLRNIEDKLYSHANLIVTVSDGIRQNLVSRGLPPEKVVTYTNGFDFSVNPKIIAVPEPPEIALDRPRVGYIGTHGLAHGLEALVAAAQLLTADFGRPDIQIIFMGDGAKKNRLKALASSLNLRNIIFLDPVPSGEVMGYWRLLDLAVIHLLDKPAFRDVIPSKLFESMAAGVPVVHCVAGESARLVEQLNIGRVVPAENPLEIAKAILELLNDEKNRVELSRNAEAAAHLFNRREIAAALVNCIEEVINSA